MDVEEVLAKPEKGSDRWVTSQLVDALNIYRKAHRKVMSVVECNSHFDQCLDTFLVMQELSTGMVDHLKGRGAVVEEWIEVSLPNGVSWRVEDSEESRNLLTRLGVPEHVLAQ